MSFVRFVQVLLRGFGQYQRSRQQLQRSEQQKLRAERLALERERLEFRKEQAMIQRRGNLAALHEAPTQLPQDTVDLAETKKLLETLKQSLEGKE